jgi:hypothetical protein
MSTCHFQGLDSSLVHSVAGPGGQLKAYLDGLQACFQIVPKSQCLHHNKTEDCYRADNICRAGSLPVVYVANLHKS